MTRRLQTSTLFPYTTLFRSNECASTPENSYRDWFAFIVAANGSLRLINASSSARAASTVNPGVVRAMRSEEHTSELQSQFHLVCRLLLEKKNKKHEEEFRDD